MRAYFNCVSLPSRAPCTTSRHLTLRLNRLELTLRRLPSLAFVEPRRLRLSLAASTFVWWSVT